MASGGRRPGAGRKSAYQEQADARTLAQMFFKKYDVERLRRVVAGRKHSMRDVMLLKALDGDSRMIVAVFRKLFPDRQEHRAEGQIGTALQLLREITEKENE